MLTRPARTMFRLTAVWPPTAVMGSSFPWSNLATKGSCSKCRIPGEGGKEEFFRDNGKTPSTGAGEWGNIRKIKNRKEIGERRQETLQVILPIVLTAILIIGREHAHNSYSPA